MEIRNLNHSTCRINCKVTGSCHKKKNFHNKSEKGMKGLRRIFSLFDSRFFLKRKTKKDRNDKNILKSNYN